MGLNKLNSLLSLLIIPHLALAITVEVRNSHSHSRAKEVVAIDWKALEKQEPGLRAENARVRDAQGKILLSQAVDNNGDGIIDELLFLTDFKAQESKKFEVIADSSLKMPESAIRAFARYVPERKDDFAWENDLIAFRAYGPALREGIENCGFDCLMKRVEYPVLDKWYQAEKQGKSYHIDWGEGYDGYKVGESLGCGGSAVWMNGKMYKSDTYTSWRQFANGPIRAVFELSYGPWEVLGKQITEKKLISIELGKRMFKVEDSFLVNGKPERVEIVIGVTTHEGKAEAFGDPKKGYLYAWEKIDGYGLGTGVVLSPNSIKEYKLIDSKKPDEAHALFVASTSAEGKITYYAGYGWEKAKGIMSREQWEEYLEQFVKALSAPLEIKLK